MVLYAKTICAWLFQESSKIMNSWLFVLGKIQQIFVGNKPHEIHENLNPTKNSPHTVCNCAGLNQQKWYTPTIRNGTVTQYNVNPHMFVLLSM